MNIIIKQRNAVETSKGVVVEIIPFNLAQGIVMVNGILTAVYSYRNGKHYLVIEQMYRECEEAVQSALITVGYGIYVGNTTFRALEVSLGLFES